MAAGKANMPLIETGAIILVPDSDPVRSALESAAGILAGGDPGDWSTMAVWFLESFEAQACAGGDPGRSQDALKALWKIQNAIARRSKTGCW
jgi:hypothetical protein